MRARLFASVGVLAAATLLLTGGAAADDGGFSPVTPRSPNADRIETSYWFVFGFAAAIFLLVEIALIVFIIRFRSRGRGREVEGPQVRGHTNLELAWTAVPVLILVAIAVFVFYKLPGIKDVPKAGAAGPQYQLEVEGRQFYWQFKYPNGVISIDRLRVPVGRPVRLEVTAPGGDVIHSWWIPALGGKIDAIPGERHHTWFEATRAGVYRGQCAEFCGIQHAEMYAAVEAVPADEFDRWLSDQARAQNEGTSDLGEQEFEGVCAKCHGPEGEGGIGPAIDTSPAISDKRTLETIVENGTGAMPAVGRGWSKRQTDALFSYLQNRFGEGGGSGGSS